MINDDVRMVHTAAKTISDYCDNHNCNECYFLEGDCMVDRIFSKSAVPLDYERNIREYINRKENKKCQH